MARASGAQAPLPGELPGEYASALAKAEGRDVEEDLDEATKAKLDAETLDDGWDD